MLHHPPRRPRPPASRSKIWSSGTIALLVLLAGCQTCPPIPPSPPLPVRAPCVVRAPELPALTMERLPDDAPPALKLIAALQDRERLIGYADEASVLLAGCTR